MKLFITLMKLLHKWQIKPLRVYHLVKLCLSLERLALIKTKQGVPFIYDEHTAETAVYYAVDLGKSYRLIDESMLVDLKLTEQQIREMSLFNVRKLSNSYTTDEVKGNIFYFINSNDGYDASRILNTAFLNEIEAQCQGEMLVAVPHQDVLIIADIRNKTGYDVMAHLTMEFFTKGLVPITSLSFDINRVILNRYLF